MAHLLIIELPGGNDTDIIEAAIRMGHSFVFLTQDESVYRRNTEVYEWISKAQEIIESPSFHFPVIIEKVEASHRLKKINAILCLIDIRLIETAKLAEHLHLTYLNVPSAQLLRDKFSVRQQLESKGIVQPKFALATKNEEIKPAIHKVGLPILMKPSDGYGSQNILTIGNDAELDLCSDILDHLLPIAQNYGLGVRSNDRLLIESYMKGHFIGCDTFSLNGRHQLLGVNEKLMFDPPSFAIKGGCFVPNKGEWSGLEKYLFSILDAVNFDCGAAHIEVMITEDGPRLVEINPRLVGAKIARLMSYALGCSVHELLINLHLGSWPLDQLDTSKFEYAVTRWIVSESAGVLDRIDFADNTNHNIKNFAILAKTGDVVSPPIENVNRLGYVMTANASREAAEYAADEFVSSSKIVLKH